MVWDRKRLMPLVVIIAQTNMTAFTPDDLITNAFKRSDCLASRNNRQSGHLAGYDHGSNQGPGAIGHRLPELEQIFQAQLNGLANIGH